ncbi:hypothetical protein EJ06DRAFT_194298 [Trichodelitschia bisporula]|uniref:Uncharacterized protein n=1 Tax=Trichodelitschia bisporula TaxID=703511 RepID=A0A6G1I896_9PEZI|nr:hypothetical protein EJ06DRAFT_194298 [Trichodelitschia bisporula]
MCTSRDSTYKASDAPVFLSRQHHNSHRVLTPTFNRGLSLQIITRDPSTQHPSPHHHVQPTRPPDSLPRAHQTRYGAPWSHRTQFDRADPRCGSPRRVSACVGKARAEGYRRAEGFLMPGTDVVEERRRAKDTVSAVNALSRSIWDVVYVGREGRD